MKQSIVILMVLAAVCGFAGRSFPAQTRKRAAPAKSTRAPKPSAVKTTPQNKSPRIVETVLPKNYPRSRVQLAQSFACTIYLPTLGDVIGHGYMIIVGTPTQDFYARRHITRYHVPSRSDDDPQQYSEEEWTTGTFRVTQVLAGGKPRITLGQVIQVTETVGLTQYDGEGFFKTVTEDCTELKQNSRYVLFVYPRGDGSFQVGNFNRGRFNIDGTDPEDDIGGGIAADGTKTPKQKLRDELTARYGVVFNFLPQVTITKISDELIVSSLPPSGIYPPPLPATDIAYAFVDKPLTRSTLSIEREQGDGTWKVIGQQDAYAPGGEMFLSPLAAGSVLRARLTSGSRTSNYSHGYKMP